MKRKLIYSKSNLAGLVPVLVMACFMISPLAAQQSEVRVVKPYSPTLSGAEKIQLLPDMDEEIDFEPPVFSYQLYPKKYDSRFQVEPIQAARMVKMPLKKLYKSEVTLGMGNYLSPLAELKINQLRSRDGTFGLSLRHHSMNGGLKLTETVKVPAGFSENDLMVNGKRFLKNSVFSYDAGVGYYRQIHYGIDTTGYVGDISRDSLRHSYFMARGAVGLHSMHADSFHFNYDAKLAYYYFTHQFEQGEHGASLSIDFDKKLKQIDLYGEVGGNFYGHYPDWDNYLGNHVIAWLNPMIGMGNDQWRFTGGFKTYVSVIDGDALIHFYPRATFQFKMVEAFIIPFFGVDGYLESNNYRKIFQENPFVMPDLSVKPTSHRLIGYAGLKGRVESGFSYKIKGSYSVIDNQYFFVNDTTNLLMNQFTVNYMDMTMLKIQAELVFRPSDSWKVFLKGNYYIYNHENLSDLRMANDSTRNLRADDHPWNMPDFDASLQLRYNMGDKIVIQAGIYAIGKRYYEDFSQLTEESLPLTIDANLGAEYHFSNMLTFWLRINNVAAQRYYLYHQYPALRFRAMLGFSYTL